MALGTLTAVPVAPPRSVGPATARVAMLLGPVAAAPIAVVAGLLGWAASLVLPTTVTAVLILGCFGLGSRALHLDGLADTADGLAASYDRDRALEIMRRGNTGPAGAAALVLVLLLQTAALAAVVTRPWGVACAVALLCLARSSLLITCGAGVPAARPGGLGAVVAGVISRPWALGGGIGAAAVAAVVLHLSDRPWWQGPVAVLLGGAAVAALTLRCRRRFGGITGDVLGAGIEIAAAALLVAAAG
jgi:adenosylcobinamide-GDP ribazoletransferase